MVNAFHSKSMMIAVRQKSETTTTKKKLEKSDLVVLRPCDYRGVFFSSIITNANLRGFFYCCVGMTAARQLSVQCLRLEGRAVWQYGF